MDPWIIIVGVVVIVILFLMNKSKKDDIQQLQNHYNNERTKLQNEINELKQAVATGEITLKATTKNNTAATNELRAEICKLTKDSQEKYNVLQQKYFKLLRAYMVFRKKSEVDAIDEIENSITEDYEALGSSHVMITQYIASAMADFYTLRIKETEKYLQWMGQLSRSDKIAEVRKVSETLINRAKLNQYTFELTLVKLLNDHPEIDKQSIDSFYGTSLSDVDSYINAEKEISRLRQECDLLKNRSYSNEVVAKYKYEISCLKRECDALKEQVKDFNEFQDKRWPLLRESVEAYQKEFESNLTAIPYMSRLIADIMTVDLDRMAWALSWGNNQERQKKVASLTLLKKEKAEEIEKIKGAEYQLAYLLELYPALQDVIDAEFKELDISYSDITEYDPVLKYIEKEEWQKLTDTERNQLALNRYVESRQKSKWQIGRDYELYCGYCYEQKGYTVDYYGSYHGLEDLGRDLIIKHGDEVRIVQCKYWSQSKQIHENHIMQLYGSVIEYNIENNANATGILLTNTVLSDKAKEFAKVLGITFKEHHSLGEFPRIKCNIGVEGKIYHLPFDQQYDATIIEGKDEFMALTVAEAEKAGFRRAYRWHGNN